MKDGLRRFAGVIRDGFVSFLTYWNFSGNVKFFCLTGALIRSIDLPFLIQYDVK